MNTENQALFSARVRECACRIKREGVGALGDLYDLTAARLYRYALTITRHQQDAEDVLQAVMVRVTLHSQCLADAAHPWAYFLRILRNESLRVAQKKRRSRETTGFSEMLESSGIPGETLVDFGTSELRELVQKAMLRLPREQSEIVALKIWEEMTFAEISEVLDESPNTVASRYRYALQKLTQSLEPLANEVFRDE